MYPISPIYANRQYAASEGVYKVHAASKATAVQRSGEQTLFDMMMAYNDYVRPSEDKEDSGGGFGSSKRDGARKQAGFRSEEGNALEQSSAASKRSGSRSMVTDAYNRTIIADPPDGARTSKTFSPYGRFRELGFDADHLPGRSLPANRQRLQSSMLAVYGSFGTARGLMAKEA